MAPFPGQKAPRTLISSCQGGELGVAKKFKGFFEPLQKL